MNVSEEEAERIYAEQSAYVFRLALFLTKSRSMAEDIVQETFIQVFKALPHYDASRPIQPWIYKITLNTVRKSLRKTYWSSIWNKHHGDEPESVEAAILREESNQQLWEKVNALPIKSKEVIYLHYYLELKLTEIAEILDIPIGTCKSRLHTALKSLRKKLSEAECAMTPSSEIGG
ncbi:RNA polymerase sigma factor [Paenibacillus chartarius]|uniref:RNA polymerase sigma factor n=1 Tax=Paenibacillus chartarius TaxID=747481 RepID=A0ABV6DVL4_9BACL